MYKYSNIGCNKRRALRWILLGTLALGTAQATSIVVKATDKRIIVAADTLASEVDVSSTSLNPTKCKIISLGDAAFAATGNVDYKRNKNDDVVGDWDAFGDARTTYTLHGGSLRAAADDWSARATTHYQLFYAVAPARVRALASVNAQGVLVVGLFVGWEGSKASTVAELITLDETKPLSPINVHAVVLSTSTYPVDTYSSNGVTQELIEGNSERAKAAATQWKTKSITVPQRQRDWRWLEFLIKTTGLYDKDVGGEVEVLQMLPNGRQQWLQNTSCPKITSGRTHQQPGRRSR